LNRGYLKYLNRGFLKAEGLKDSKERVRRGLGGKKDWGG